MGIISSISVFISKLADGFTLGRGENTITVKGKITLHGNETNDRTFTFPDADSNVVTDSTKASQAESEAGVDDEKYMTPLKTKQAITAIGGGVTNHSGLTLDDGPNPHGTTSSDVGLGNVDNTSDADKPVSTAQQTALDGKVNTSDKSSQAEAEAGVDDTKWMTPLRTLDAINENVPEVDFSSDDFALNGSVLTTVKGYETSSTTVEFDRNRIYGDTETPVTGNISSTNTGAVKGAEALILHQDSTEPSYPDNFYPSSVSATYSTSSSDVNVIRCQYIADDLVLYTNTVVVQESLDPNLLAWFEFEEGSGAVAGDSTGHNNDGTIDNTPANWPAGPVGTAIELSGAGGSGNDPYITVASSTELAAISTTFSIAFWLRQVGDSGGYILDNLGSANRSINIFVLSTNKRLEINLNEVLEGYGTYRVRATSGNPVSDTFKHFCFTYDGSTLSLYINGSLDASQGSIPSIDVNSDGTWYWGIESDLTSAPSAVEIDDLRVYDKVLTAQEISDLHALGS